MNHTTPNLTITWYGRCCFLVTYKDTTVLFDPYDTYCSVDIGEIEADILLCSSTWHDHGHIGASPQAHVYSYPGEYKHGDVRIVGIEALEDRGTPTVIFNLTIGPYSITNFADFGPEQQKAYEASVSEKERAILAKTNIAFIRPSVVREKVAEKSIHNEIALEYCQPKAIFPEHYFPRSFTEKHIPVNEKIHFLRPLRMVDGMIKRFGYPVREIAGYTVQLSIENLQNTKIYQFLELHPQVFYKQ